MMKMKKMLGLKNKAVILFLGVTLNSLGFAQTPTAAKVGFTKFQTFISEDKSQFYILPNHFVSASVGHLSGKGRSSLKAEILDLEGDGSVSINKGFAFNVTGVMQTGIPELKVGLGATYYTSETNSDLDLITFSGMVKINSSSFSGNKAIRVTPFGLYNITPNLTAALGLSFETFEKKARTESTPKKDDDYDDSASFTYQIFNPSLLYHTHTMELGLGMIGPTIDQSKRNISHDNESKWYVFSRVALQDGFRVGGKVTLTNYSQTNSKDRDSYQFMVGPEYSFSEMWQLNAMLSYEDKSSRDIKETDWDYGLALHHLYQNAHHFSLSAVYNSMDQKSESSNSLVSTNLKLSQLIAKLSYGIEL